MIENLQQRVAPALQPSRQRGACKQVVLWELEQELQHNELRGFDQYYQHLEEPHPQSLVI